MNNKVNQEFEKRLWASADALRGNISSEEYMHIVIGIMFLKHLSDKYDLAKEEMKKNSPNTWEDDIKDKDFLEEYSVSFIVPEKAHWNYISKYAQDEKIGSIIDDAFDQLENENPELRGLFDKNYNREELDQNKLGMVVSEFSNMNLKKFGEDVVGRVYEYFLGQFFVKQGQKGGEFYTPNSIVELMVKIINPEKDKDKIYDPTAGTGGMLVQAKNFIEEHYGKEQASRIVAYGQEYQNKTWKLSRINLLLHGFSNDNIKLGLKSADTFTDDQHKGERFNYILANPPFNVKKWGYEELINDSRWEWGRPPKGNANYAFISHMIHKLKNDGRGATVLANGSLSGSGKEEMEIRKNLVEANYIDAIISLPDKLFYTVQIPVSIWVFNKNKKSDNILMIEAKGLEGKMLSKKNRELTNEDITKMVETYRNHSNGKNIEELGFSKTITKNDLIENNFSFVPGRYVGIEKQEIDKELTQKEIIELSNELDELFQEFNELVPQVKESIKKSIERLKENEDDNI